MNWRRVALRYAAGILDEIGQDRLAAELRSVHVPILDGGGFKVGMHCSRQADLDAGEPKICDSRDYQNFDSESIGAEIARQFAAGGKDGPFIYFPIYLEVRREEIAQTRFVADLPKWIA